MKKMALVALTAVLAVFPALTAEASGGDARAGKQVFTQCAACHKIDASGTSGIGPNLNKVVGRRIGTLPGFRYSPAMAGASRVWTERELDAYLAAPAKTLPGNKMPYAGMARPADRQNVIAYIKSASR